MRQAVQTLVASTAHCSGFTVNVCLSYGGRDEILQACAALAREAGELAHAAASHGRPCPPAAPVSEERFASCLLTAPCGDPDLLIRTSGEHRLSNFLLWQLAYTELFFVDKYWPEMTRQDLRDVLGQFAERHRRYGS